MATCSLNTVSVRFSRCSVVPFIASWCVEWDVKPYTYLTVASWLIALSNVTECASAHQYIGSLDDKFLLQSASEWEVL